jgi:hypothetical protein
MRKCLLERVPEVSCSGLSILLTDDEIARIEKRLRAVPGIGGN